MAGTEYQTLKIGTHKVALVTGAAGFIGFHVCNCLLTEGWRVIAIDSLSEYYDVSLKISRLEILKRNENFVFVHGEIETPPNLMDLFKLHCPNIVVHLAAQAGVRHSIENPKSYIDSNILGTFQLLEAAREYPPEHMLLASTSSVYGLNKSMPYTETDQCDDQVSLYAATKKSNESIAHAYSYLFNLNITMFRFFTVYGPWGRPDMALFKFTKAILNNDPIDLYNYGDLRRDFTYIDDLVKSIMLLIQTLTVDEIANGDKLDPTQKRNARFRVVNIGNANPTDLKLFVEVIEEVLGKKAQINLMPMQPGDVYETWANTDLLYDLTGYRPNTDLRYGVRQFINWYRKFYNIK